MGRRRKRNDVFWVVSLVVVGLVATTGVPTTAAGTPTTYQDPHHAAIVSQAARVPVSEGPGRENTSFIVPTRDHGIDPDTYPQLWSGDVDEADTASDESVLGVLLGAADIPFDRPPDAVNEWNRGDHQDFPTTDTNEAVYPPNADRSSALWIEDAYIEVFALQPSTVTHVSPDDTRHYIRRNGQVLGTTDYRIELPPDVHHEYDPPAPDPGEAVLLEKHVTWRLLEHGRSDVTLEADGEPVASIAPTHTPSITYSSLDPATEGLALEVTISGSFEKTTRRKFRSAYEDCDTRTITEGNETRTVTVCSIEYETYWETDIDRPSRQVTVRDAVAVEVYDLDPTVTRTDFADGGTAVAVNRSTGDPWVSFAVPSVGSVHNVWHFYSARNQDWDRLVVGSRTDATSHASDAIPLQVHAFPSGGGAYARAEFGDLDVVRVWGEARTAPGLPETITLPVVDGSYSDGSVVVARSGATTDLDDEIVVRGLVRGTESRTSIESIRTQRAAELDLELVGLNRSAGEVSVRLTLQDAETDEPIDLRSRPGVVDIHGVEAETNASGVAVVTAPRVGSFVTAEYRPGAWWETTRTYESTRATVGIPAEWPRPRHLVIAWFTLVTWIAPFLLVVYYFDRLLGGRMLWPPWRGLE